MRRVRNVTEDKFCQSIGVHRAGPEQSKEEEEGMVVVEEEEWELKRRKRQVREGGEKPDVLH